MLSPDAHVRMRARKGLASRACVTPASLQASCLAASVSLRLGPSRVRRSRRLRATLAAAPVLFAQAFGPNHMEKTYGTGGITGQPHPGAVI